MIPRTIVVIAAASLVIAAAACAPDRSPDDAEPTVEVPGAPTGFAPELDIDLNAMTRSPSGLYIRDLEAGAGEPVAAGDHVVVHYTGWLPQGTEFDSSRGRDPFEFLIGQQMVIPGWDEGVAGMRPGGRRQLVIPPDLAYGEQGTGGTIPPNSALVFDVELLEVR